MSPRPDYAADLRTQDVGMFSVCGIVLDDGSDCRGQVVADIGLNLCAAHLRQAYETYRATAPRRKVEAEEITLCPTCGETTMHPGDTGRKCAWCGHQTDDFAGGDMLDLSAVVPNFRASNVAQATVKRAAVVYYIAFGDRIKIGTSTNLRARLQELPFDKVLAIEPGGIGLERRRHDQFARTRVRGEWFEHSPQLLAHIESLQRPGMGWQNILSEIEQA